MSVRPQTLIFPFLPIVGLWIVNILCNGKSPQWWLVALVTWVWAILHGSAIMVAPILLLAFFLRFLFYRPNRKQLLSDIAALLAASVAPLLTPIGINIWVSAFRLREACKDFITEWLPLTFGDDPYAWALLCAAIFWVYVGIKSVRKNVITRKQLWLETIFLLILLVGASSASRNVYVCVPIISVLIVMRAASYYNHVRAYTWERFNPTQKTANMFHAACVAVLAVTIMVTSSFATVSTAHVVPTLWSTMNETPGPHRVFSSWNVGSQPIFWGNPGTKTFMNSPADLFGPNGIKTLQTFYEQPQENIGLLDNYQITDIVIEKNYSKLSTLERNGWKIVATEGEYVLLQKTG